jgi:TPP-dependent pyruvate/acetoin dehydrogenase alpha subunit
VITIYDDGYGISVPNEMQMVKGNLSELLRGFQRERGRGDGYDLYRVKGWDYPALLDTYRGAIETVRREHVPALIHVVELTQPLGHSTSGSQERYKTPERLAWEAKFDGLRKFREWILDQGLAPAEELDQWEEEERVFVEEARKRAWEAYLKPILQERKEVAGLIDQFAQETGQEAAVGPVKNRLLGIPVRCAGSLCSRPRCSDFGADQDAQARQALIAWKTAGAAECRPL